jgi:hypothetical protein
MGLAYLRQRARSTATEAHGVEEAQISAGQRIDAGLGPSSSSDA